MYQPKVEIVQEHQSLAVLLKHTSLVAQTHFVHTTLNLNISAPRQNIKNLNLKNLDVELSLQYANFFLSSINHQGGDVSDRHTDRHPYRDPMLYKNTKARSS